MPATRRQFVGSVLVGAAGLPLLGRNASAQPTEPSYTEIHHPADPAHPTGAERERAPTLSLPARVHAARPFELGITIGQPPRRGSPEDHVEWIEVRAGTGPVARISLGPAASLPSVRLWIELPASTTLRVLAMWSQNGLWETLHAVTVT